MSPTVRRYSNSFNLAIEPELKRRLLALSYILGHEGRYSTLGRFLIRSGVEREINSLSPDKREEFEKTLENLTKTALVKSQILEDSLLQENMKDDESIAEPEGSEPRFPGE